jgi:surface polysaccharide O-acyltransferase-like enzyme
LILAPLFHDHYSLGQFVSAVLRTKVGRTDHLWFLMAMTYIYLLFPFIKALYDKSEKVYTTYMVVLLFVCTFGFVFLDEVAKAAGFFLHSATLSQMDVKNFLWGNPFDKWYGYTILYFISGGLLAKNIEPER